MKKFLFVFCALSALAACDKHSSDDRLIRRCGEYLVEMAFNNAGEEMNAIINGDAVTLNLVVSASGAKYDGVLNDTTVTLWGKGDDWTMILDEDMVFSCVAE